MTDNDHPFADEISPIVVLPIGFPFMDSKPSIEHRVFKTKTSKKKKDLQTYEAIGKSLANVRMTEQLFASNKKQVIFGNIPSKSNCYKIITLKSKDPIKRPMTSLGKTSALAKYEKDFFIQCNIYRNKMMDGYLQIEVDVYYPSQRSDLDNSLKVLLDCLQKVKAFKNDNKITRIVANKFLDARNPRIEFEIKQSM